MSSGPGRLLGLDYGRARIGLALSDALGLTAQPLPALVRTNIKRDLGRLRELVRENEVVAAVVGLPLQMSGEEGEASAEVRAFGERLGRSLAPLRIELWDERLSTVEAERTLIQGDVRRKRRTQLVDSLAASLILQSYLDSQSMAGPPP